MAPPRLPEDVIGLTIKSDRTFYVRASCITKTHGIKQLVLETDKHGRLPELVSISIAGDYSNPTPAHQDPRRDWEEWMKRDLRDTMIRCKIFAGTVYVEDPSLFMKIHQEIIKQTQISNVLYDVPFWVDDALNKVWGAYKTDTPRRTHMGFGYSMDGTIVRVNSA